MIIVYLILLASSLWLLGMQMMIVRQIGILHARSAGNQDGRELPVEVKTLQFTSFEGVTIDLAAAQVTPVIILSTNCYLCKPIIKGISEGGLPAEFSLGLIGVQPSVLGDFCQAQRLPLSRTFDATKLRSELKLWEIPGLVILTSSGKVAFRTPVDSLKTAIAHTDAFQNKQEKYEPNQQEKTYVAA